MKTRRMFAVLMSGLGLTLLLGLWMFTSGAAAPRKPGDPISNGVGAADEGTLTPQACTDWNLASDFRRYPNQENPSRDACGNPGVWQYMSADLSRQAYALLPYFTTSVIGVPGLHQWHGTYYNAPEDYHPHVTINATGADHGTWPANAVYVHPAPSEMVVVAWRSPLDGAVSVSGSVADPPIGVGCGDGILWYIDLNAVNLASGSYPDGGAQDFRDGTGGDLLANISVSQGDMLYFAIHPGGDFCGDTTDLRISIHLLAGYPLVLTPPTQTGQGGRGQVVAYTETLINNAGITDTFDLTIGPHIWDTALSADRLGPIASGDSMAFTVNVTVPVDADWYSTDVVTVTATSVTSPTVYSDTATFTTQAYAPPLISVSPEVLTSTQYVNEIVTRLLTISNGNGVTLTFNLGSVPMTGTLLLMHLDEPAGATAFRDDSGHNNHGSCSGASCPTAGAGGRFGKALRFDGGDDYVAVGSPVPSVLQIQNEMALEAWIYATEYPAPDTLGTIVGCQYGNGTGASGYAIHLDGRTSPHGPPYISPPGHIHFQIGDGNWHMTEVNAQVPLDQWVHVVAVRKANEDGRVYYNGVQQPSASVPWNGAVTYSGAELDVGRESDWGNRYFKGIIDEVAIYDRALSAQEVQARYLSGLGGVRVPWLSTEPVSGTVTASSSTSVQVTFDATGLQPGDYTTAISIRSNDPFTPSVSVPVTMTVLPAADMGWVEGTITDAWTGVPLTATVIALGQPYTITTKPDGTYKLWLDAGSYSLEAAAAGYVTQTVAVTITAQQGIAQDFHMELNVPRLRASPASLAATPYVGDVTTRTLTIANDGPAPLTFNILSADLARLVLWNRLGSDDEVLHSEVGENGAIVGTSYAYEPAMHGNGYVKKAYWQNYVRFPASILDRLTERGAVELWVNPKVPQPVPYQYGVFGLLGAYYGHGGEPTDWSVGLFWGDTVTFRGLVGGIRFDGSLARTPDEPSQFVATPLVPFHAAISWDIAGIGGTADKVRVYRDGAVVGSTTDSWNPDGTQRGDIILNTTADSGGADKFIVDNIKIWNYAKTDFSDRFVEAPIYAPWLSAEPVSGTVTSNSSTPVQATFDATGLQPDTYTTTVAILSNDPITPSVSIPVTMTVNPTASMGWVEGTVTDAWTGAPLTATVIAQGQPYTITTQPDGTYKLWLDAGSYTLQASAAGYVTQTAVVSITAQQGITQNFALELNVPRLEVSPESLQVTHQVGEVTTRVLAITNDGPAPLDFEISSGSGVSFLAVSTELYGYDVPDAWLRIIGTEDNTRVRVINLINGSIISENADLDRYAIWDVYPSDGTPYKVEADKPVLGYESDWDSAWAHNTFVPSLDSGSVGREFVFYFFRASYSYVYVFAVDDTRVSVFDTSGRMVDTRMMSAGQYWDISIPNAVYRVVSTGRIAIENVGADGYTTVPSIDANGVGYRFYFGTYGYFTGAFAVFAYQDADVNVYDLDSGSLFYSQHVGRGTYWWQRGVGTRRLRLESTGLVEVWAGDAEGCCGIEYLGDDISFAGGDRGREYYLHSLIEGSVIFAPFDNTRVNVDGTLYRLDKDAYLYLGGCCYFRHIQSNQPVLIQTLGQDNAWNNMGTYLGGVLAGGGNLPPWLTADPLTGTVPGHSSVPVQVTFDATGIQPGDYTTMFSIMSNDPVTPSVSVPVTMTVNPTINMGWVEGTVIDAATGAPLTATVIALGQPYTVTTKPDGTYKLWLDTGNHTLQAAATGYFTGTVVVTITAQQGITQDFALELNVPRLKVSPESLDVTHQAGDVTTRTLTIANDGPAPLTFNIGSQVSDAVLLMHLDEPAGATTFRDDSGNDNHGSCSGASCPTAGVDGRFGRALSFDGMDDYVQVPDSSSLRPSPFTIVAWFQWNDVGTADIDFITAKGYENYEIHTGGYAGTNGVRFIPAGGISSAFDVPGVIHAGWNHIAVVYTEAEAFVYFDGRLAGSRSGITGGNDLSADTAQFYVGRRGDGTYFFNGLIDEVALYDRVLSAQEVEALYLSGPGGRQVPWLSTEPVSGTVTTNSSTLVEVTFDATDMQPDTYTTTLVIWSNDPITPSVSVPVTMTVLRTADMGRVTGAVSDAWTGLPLTATVELVGIYSMTASPNYTIWAPAGVYSLTAYTSGYFTITRPVAITAGGVITEDLALEPAQPRLEWAPAAVTARAVEGSKVAQTLMILNTGPVPLNVALHEINPAVALQALSSTDLAGKRILYDRAHGEPGSSEYSSLISDATNAGAVVTENWYFPIEAAVLEGYDVLWVNCCGGITWGFRELQAVNDWLNKGGALLVQGESSTATNGPASIFGIYYFSASCTSGTTRNIIKHPISEGVSAVNVEWTCWRLAPPSGADIVVFDPQGQPHVVANEQHGGKIVVVASEDFHDSYIGNDDNRLLANNILAWLARPAYGDVPWLSETPGAGVIPGHASLPVVLSLNASALLPDEYRATLAIEHNDPAQVLPVEVPVTLMVVSPPRLHFPLILRERVMAPRPRLIFPLILKNAPGPSGKRG